jgi:hypothetical protein
VRVPDGLDSVFILFEVFPDNITLVILRLHRI